MWIGEFSASDVVDFKFTTRGTTGAPSTLGGTPALSVYKGNGTTESTTGITLTADFDARTGLNHVRITTASDGTFYADGNDFQVVITTGTVGGTSVVGEVVAHFTLRNRAGLKPTTAGRTLDVSAGGEAGLDWANIGGPTTAVSLSGTSTKALEPTTTGRTLDVTATGEAGIDWANIGAPTTVVNLSGTTVKAVTDRVLANTDQWAGGTIPAPNVTGIPKVDLVKVNGTDATGVGTVPVEPASVRAAIGMAAANLDTQLAAIDDFVDTEVAAIKAVTDKLNTALELDGAVYRFTVNALEQAPVGGGGGATDWTVDERTAIRTILGIPAAGTTPDVPTAGALKVIDDFLDTEVAAIKAKTDSLPADPADASDIAALIGAIPTTAQINAEVLDVLATDTLIDGKTVVRALQIIGASAAGKVSGAGSGTETFKGLDGATDRLVVLVDIAGNRATVTYP